MGRETSHFGINDGTRWSGSDRCPSSSTLRPVQRHPRRCQSTVQVPCTDPGLPNPCPSHFGNPGAKCRRCCRSHWNRPNLSDGGTLAAAIQVDRPHHGREGQRPPQEPRRTRPRHGTRLGRPRRLRSRTCPTCDHASRTWPSSAAAAEPTSGISNRSQTPVSCRPSNKTR